MAGGVVIVSAVQPLPADSGKKVVLAGFLEHLSGRLGRDGVHYVLVGDSEPLPEAVPARVHRVEGPGRAEQVLNLGSLTLTGRRSIQESLLYGRRTRRELAALLAHIDADVEIYDTIRFGQYLASRRRDERRVVYLDDLFSERYGAMLATLRAHPQLELDALGDFGDKVPAPLRALVQRRGVQRVALSIERVLVRGREQAMVRAADACLLVSDAESQLLRERTGGEVGTVPPLIPDLPTAGSRAYGGTPDFVLLGLLSLPHNHDGALVFLERVLPDLLQRLPEARVRIVGRHAPDDVRAAAARFGDRVTLEGYVADLQEVLLSAAALVNPLRFGSGIKIKVLQALAAGVPVVSTPVGVEGIVTGSGHGIVVAELDDLAEALVGLTDQRVNQRTGAAARQCYEQRYSPEAAGAVYDRWLVPPSRGSAG